MKRLITLLIVIVLLALVTSPAYARPRHSFQAVVVSDAQVFDVYHMVWFGVYAEQEVTVDAVVQNDGLKCFIRVRAPLPVNWRAGWMPCSNLRL